MSEKCPECDCEIDYVYCGNCGEMVNLDVWMRELRKEDEDLLLEVILQACGKRDCPHSEWYLDSMALSTYADAIRFLAKRKRVEIINEGGRRVIAKMVA